MKIYRYTVQQRAGFPREYETKDETKHLRQHRLAEGRWDRAGDGIGREGGGAHKHEVAGVERRVLRRPDHHLRGVLRRVDRVDRRVVERVADVLGRLLDRLADGGGRVHGHLPHVLGVALTRGEGSQKRERATASVIARASALAAGAEMAPGDGGGSQVPAARGAP